MNEADSRHAASLLEQLGLKEVASAADADIVILNTCVVRQQPEDKAVGRLLSLKGIKEKRPDMMIALMGCFVGVKKTDHLEKRFPFVDLFIPPSAPNVILNFLHERFPTLRQTTEDAPSELTDYRLPAMYGDSHVTAFVPAVLGCSHACAFCIIPYRRGAERSRPAADILAEAKSLASQGVREITVLGQIIDRYGMDLEDGPTLAQLLLHIAEIDELKRIRFLTSHPTWMTDDLLDAVANHPKLCPHIEVALQSGNNEVLERMQRGYTREDFLLLIKRIRQRIPDACINTDIIVGFPGETDEQFQDTVSLIQEIEFDMVHIAKYSERPQTYAARHYPDDLPAETKEQRRKTLEDIQTDIMTRKNADLKGRTVPVLVETKDKNRWRGRTPHNRIVFFESTDDCLGREMDIHIDWAGPFSLIGTPEEG